MKLECSLQCPQGLPLDLILSQFTPARPSIHFNVTLPSTSRRSLLLNFTDKYFVFISQFCQGMPLLLRNTKANYLVHKRRPLDPILSQMNPFI
jgi:hypothetical protein